MRKSVLLTNRYIKNFTGSELNIFELVNEFLNNKYDITIATFDYEYPLKQFFEDKNIKVVNVLYESLCRTKFDLIWAQHTPVLYQCIFESDVTANKLVYSSLSPYESMEVPPVFANEINLCLANSKETKVRLLSEGVKEEKIFVFNNSVRDAFFYFYEKINIKRLNKICIVSNHVPNDILEAVEIFRRNGIDVDIYGTGYSCKIITGDVLKDYDTIITIGKTVQYALAMGIPVYCYDRFGGPGWITMKNIKNAEYYNFSGRCCNRKIHANEIVNEITGKFNETLLERKDLNLYAKLKFSLKNNVNKVENIINKTNDVEINYIKNKYSFIKRSNEYYINLLKEYNNLEKKLELAVGGKMINIQGMEVIYNAFDCLIREYSSKKYNIVLWGTGVIGNNIMSFSKELSKNLVAVIDGGSDKIGKLFHSFVIQSPLYLKENKVDVVIVASIKFANDIIKTIKNINEDTIIISGEEIAHNF